MNAAIRGIAHALLGDYEIYRIYRRDLDPTETPPPRGVAFEPILSPDLLMASPDPELRTHVTYSGDGAHGFGAWVGGKLAGSCWYWMPERYQRDRNFWPLQNDEAKLVQISVSAGAQGRGVGGALMHYAEARMARLGVRRAYARIWHSNEPSIRMFLKAGWSEVASVTVIRPLGLRFRFVKRASR